MELIVANPRGFCAGVERAIAVVDRLADVAEDPIYVRHAIVHNHAVIRRLSGRGVTFVEETGEVPDGAVMVLSAHGVAPQVYDEAGDRDLRVIDATCPLVTRVQLEVARQSKAGRSVIVIGHRGHVEVEGLAGNFSGSGVLRVIETEDEARTVEVPDPAAVAYVTQTTLAVSQVARTVAVLKQRFPQLVAPRGDTICYATQNRQDAVRALAAQSDVIFIIGAPHSSNSNRMAEVGREAGCRSYLIESVDEITADQLGEAERIGLSSSASAPEHLVEDAIATLSRRYPGIAVRSFGTPEDLYFKPPAGLASIGSTKSMNDVQTSKSESIRVDGLKDVIDAAADLARQLRDTALAGARVGEREVAIAVDVAERARDATIAGPALKAAQEIELVARFRKSAHRVLDLAFDGIGVAVNVATGVTEDFLGARREREVKPA